MAAIKADPIQPEDRKRLTEELEIMHPVIAGFIKLGYLTGLRYSDLSKLTRKNVTINGQVRDSISIIQQKTYSKIRTLALKSGATEQQAHKRAQTSASHIVHFTEDAKEVLKELIEMQTEAGKEHLFASTHHHAKTDKAMLAQRINVVLKEVASKLGLSYQISCHSTRASAAVDLLNNGFHIKDIQHFLGHSDPNTTAIYLAKIQPDTAKTARALFL